MDIYRYVIGALVTVPLLGSCDEHFYEDASWHSWVPGMVYCTNGQVMPYEDCAAAGCEPEAVIFFVDNEGISSCKAYAVSLDDAPCAEFIDPDTVYFEQGTSADITQYDGESNTVQLRYFQVPSPIADGLNPKYFIPSVAEMYRLYDSRNVVNTSIEKCGGTPLPSDDASCWYWTSTECEGAETDRAWRFSLSSGRFEMADKHSRYATRPVISIRLNNEE